MKHSVELTLRLARQRQGQQFFRHARELSSQPKQPQEVKMLASSIRPASTPVQQQLIKARVQEGWRSHHQWQKFSEIPKFKAGSSFCTAVFFAGIVYSLLTGVKDRLEHAFGLNAATLEPEALQRLLDDNERSEGIMLSSDIAKVTNSLEEGQTQIRKVKFGEHWYYAKPCSEADLSHELVGSILSDAMLKTYSDYTGPSLRGRFVVDVESGSIEFASPSPDLPHQNLDTYFFSNFTGPPPNWTGISFRGFMAQAITGNTDAFVKNTVKVGPKGYTFAIDFAEGFATGVAIDDLHAELSNTTKLAGKNLLELMVKEYGPFVDLNHAYDSDHRVWKFASSKHAAALEMEQQRPDLKMALETFCHTIANEAWRQEQRDYLAAVGLHLTPSDPEKFLNDFEEKLAAVDASAQATYEHLGLKKRRSLRI